MKKKIKISPGDKIRIKCVEDGQERLIESRCTGFEDMANEFSSLFSSPKFLHILLEDKFILFLVDPMSCEACVYFGMAQTEIVWIEVEGKRIYEEKPSTIEGGR